MLDLDDVRWHDLRHAFGAAGDIPHLLRRLAANPAPKANWQEEPWLSLWSSLCHQGDVYTASYAALPHIVGIAVATPGPIAMDFFLLPTGIELARREGNGPVVPPFLEPAYQAGLTSLVEAIAVHLRDEFDEASIRGLCAALALAKGQTRIAEAIVELSPEWVDLLLSGEFPRAGGAR